MHVRLFFVTSFEALCFHGCLTCVWIGVFRIFFRTYCIFGASSHLGCPRRYRFQRKQDPLKAGDIVKIDLGCHIDGYIAVAAHTVIVKESPDSTAEDVARAEARLHEVNAANTALSEAALLARLQMHLRRHSHPVRITAVPGRRRGARHVIRFGTA